MSKDYTEENDHYERSGRKRKKNQILLKELLDFMYKEEPL